MFLAATVAQAQKISIGGNVYGGGNAGNMTGNTSVTVRAGDLHGVYGGARMANVGGSTFVNIDGEHASDFIIIDKVYGGNDVAGTIGTNEAGTKKIPADILTHENDFTTGVKKVDDEFDACVRISSKKTANPDAEDKKIYIGQLFGGGNGDYDYTTENYTTTKPKIDEVTGEETEEVETIVTPNPYFNLVKPVVGKAYLEICGGSIVYAYGGGNAATVTDNTVICVDNPSDVVSHIKVDATGTVVADDASGDGITELLDDARFARMGIYGVTQGFTQPSSDAFQIGRLFGGNNKAVMTIIPKWNLLNGKVRNLYSGGNEGDMTSKDGILVEILSGSTIKVDNVFGGCRKANVQPKDGNSEVNKVYSPDGFNYSFPEDLAARVIVSGGDVNNVYGGNDISGKVHFGSAVGVYTNIRGNIYGGGNGNYAYTDNPDLENDPDWGDYYYNPATVLSNAGIVPSTGTSDAMKSAMALNLFRPNAEQVSIRVAGEANSDGTKKNEVIIGGSIFVGGNCATLKPKDGYDNPLAELKIGSYVLADKVFLGNNGEKMIDASKNGVLETYAGLVVQNFSKLQLTDPDIFAEYMEGVTMGISPSVRFDNLAHDNKPNYLDYTSSFGSFYCGGNVGSVRSQDNVSNITFDHKVIIFDKLVGGCNNANVPVQYVDNDPTKQQLNAAYQGGLIGPADSDGNKLILNLSGLKIQPKRWVNETDKTQGLMWNTVDARTYDTATKTYDEVAPVINGNDDVINSDGEVISSDDDLNRRLFGGNIYGGCYTSGYVNGNVVINLNASIVDKDKLFDEVESDELGEEESLYGTSQTGKTQYKITERRTGVILGQQGMDVFGSALNVFGGGKGKDTEIWGSTTINLNEGYTFQIFGGSEEGVIGMPVGTTDEKDYVYNTSTEQYAFNGKLYAYDSKYSCYVNLKGTVNGASKKVSKENNEDDIMADCEFMYGGGFFGPICGNTIINMGKGRLFNSFAGSCNADILGHTETYIGRMVKDVNMNRMGKLGSTNILDNDTCYQEGFTWVRDITYGGNDLGGRIFNSKDFTSRVRTINDDYGSDVIGKVHSNDADQDGVRDVLVAGAYTEYLQGRADAIFGGCYGTYDYSDHKFERYTYTAIRDNEGNITGYPEDGSNATNLGDSKMNGTAPLFYKPRLNNAFVNFRPTYYSDNNVVKKVFGAGQGQSGEKERDLLQNRSYVLIDIPEVGTESEQNFNKYSTMEVFGAGSWGGVGMNLETATYNADKDKGSAIIDLIRGKISSVYGGSYEEGVTRRTLVNVPQGSTICMYSEEDDYVDPPTNQIKNEKKHGNIFGGAYGTQILPPCDVYEANVQYHSSDAEVKGAIYGGNNSERRSLYTHVEIDVPVWSNKTSGYLSSVYGAGQGQDTWAEYTEINLKPGARVYEVYGGGMMGHVLNAESVQQYMQTYSPNGLNKPSDDIATKDPNWSDVSRWNTQTVDGQTKKVSLKDEWKAAWAADWKKAWELGTYYTPNENYDNYISNGNLTNLNNTNQVRSATELDENTAKLLGNTEGKYNTNVIIHEGASVVGYAYGGGYGKVAVPLSGDIYGTTYITLLGGTIGKDVYASGTSGSVVDLFRVKPKNGTQKPNGFTASANVYIKGGTVRNVYGGGWRGSVGYHGGAISNINEDENTCDIDGEAHVVIGNVTGSTHTDGIPSITRNVYGGGEGGAIFGDAYITLNNGYIGYRYNGTRSDDPDTELDDRYVPELDDKAAGDNLLEKGGNIFGGGYVANSYVDRTHVEMLDGIVRGSLYGGGEIGPVGRGTVHTDTLSLEKIQPYKKHNYTFEGAQPAAIYKGGETNVIMWGGHVMRDVFGGGRGYDNWNGEGWFQSEEEKQNMDRSSKGYVFGTTDVRIRGGEIGTEEGVLFGYGNVFGGGNEGFVYSPTGVKTGTQQPDDQLVNGVPTDGGGFYYKDGDTSLGLTLDCNVTIEPYCKVTNAGGITISGTTYAKDKYVPVEELNKLKNRNNVPGEWAKLDTRGVTIHNALFAGGNITEGSDNLYANTVTVYGNAAASLRDVYNFDLISLGTEDMGGLYGDGNLTLVDGFRELHIDNYGTDHYSLNDTLRISDYNQLTERQKAYYKLKYVTHEEHTFNFYECKELHTYTHTENGEEVKTPYKKGQKVTEATFLAFSEAEQAKWTKGQKAFQEDDQIEEGEYILMYAGEQAKWALYGVTSIYAGRPLNTIQRADMCGVFGSRMVLKGAEDRVVDAVDYHLYTINRVDEVSLNKRSSQAGDPSGSKDFEHGNYFGIYSEVNFLGNLTSDVFFDAVRKTDSKNQDNKKDIEYQGRTLSYGEASYYEWKASMPQGKNRNNGTSHNMVALASGVHLELKRQEGELTGIDDWGYITGVVELDLINVMPGMGGGYVYARNEHGTKTWHGPESTDPWGKVTLLDYNISARTYRHFDYTKKTEVSSMQPIETSGNFVHNTKQIVDDCYPHGGIYKDGYEKSPAHYWFIRGTIYVYDQYISAYTGAANAYAEKVELPLTISAAANGRMTLREVQPNYYAYYDKNGNKLGDTSVNADETIIINNTAYKLNDPVSYWEYRMMSDAEKARFVEETYVVIDTCTVDGNLHLKGEVLLPSEYSVLRGNGVHEVTYVDGGVTKSDDNHGFDYFFRPSNNLSTNTGYVLTYDVNNPMVWNNYYTKKAAPGQENALNSEEYAEGKKNNVTINKNDYIEGPTYTLKGTTNSVYGQETINKGSIVFKKTKDKYDTDIKNNVLFPAVKNGTTLTEGKTYYTSPTDRTTAFEATGTEKADGTNYFENNQAIVTEQAYIVTKEISVKDDVTGVEVQHLNPGTPIYENNYTDAQWAAITGGSNPAAEPAKVCTSLIEFTATDYVYAGKLLSSADIATLKTKIKTKMGYTGTTADDQATEYLNKYIDDAYYCTEGGNYGGTYFVAGQAYSAIETWCSVSPEDRKKFEFNYDALDLLVDSTYSGRNEYYYGYKPQYDGWKIDSETKISDRALDPKIYSSEQPIDYQAECTEEQTYYLPGGTTQKTISVNASEDAWLSRTEYEAIPNEKHNFSPINVTKPGNYYVVNTVCLDGNIPYTVGQVIDESTYNSMSQANKQFVDRYTFTEAQSGTIERDGDGNVVKDEKGDTVYTVVTYYYCREGFEIGKKGGYSSTQNGEIQTVSVLRNGSTAQTATYVKGGSVIQGDIINQTYYNGLPNYQKGFIIHGMSPTETSTLYVSNESDIHDLSTEKIITVIYLYEYEESDESGLNVVPVSERHVVNIHINFKSGVPEIGSISKPDLVLPGTSIGMDIPTVSQGAYRVTESGWEIFDNENDAKTHTNGQEYYNNDTPVYWYQNNYWIAYYAQTYLGKTYSNSVQISVGNYHDLKKVMDDKEHHYYIDHKDVDYEPKIYINDYSESGGNGLDMFKDLIDLTFDKTVTGHTPLDLSNSSKPLRGGEYLEFFLRSDQGHTGSWTPIANGTNECFEGILHGDGHTISGLNNSLFNHLCGEVYNLGVTGTFTGAGIAEDGEGYVENCWISTSNTAAKTTKPVFGNPTRASGNANPIQVVNCYYQEEDNATAPYSNAADNLHGTAIRKPMQSFYNGEVTYNLNGFYLYKRYSDHQATSTDASQKYQYYTIGSDNSLTQHTKYYDSNPKYCSSGYKPASAGANYLAPKYVEDRFADGDFVYADGTIPGSNKRTYTDPETKKDSWFPIWPDDYIFFGQALNYDHMDGNNGRDKRDHQPLPSAINKSNDQLVTTNAGNRVFRAPAYFRSKNMGVAYFNPYAVFVDTRKDDPTTIAYKDMTAIDFTGYNDVFTVNDPTSDVIPTNRTVKPYQLGWESSNKYFYQPLLDDDGLEDIYIAGITSNVLAYTTTGTAAANKTNQTVSGYMTDQDYIETNSKYRTVASFDDLTYPPGHWVQLTDDGYMAFRDHLLYDRQDFNAPIRYTFDDDYRMWYQRKPDSYVDRTMGWEAVSLPFSAEIVTTHQKGEITHFFSGSAESQNGTHTKIGHEYWLREFDKTPNTLKPKEGVTGVLEGNFKYPSGTESSSTSDVIQEKDVMNTFLWDYYYKGVGVSGGHKQKDLNDDTYQEYYSRARAYSNYPMVTRGTPYIIGFPGSTYYEFDLSGEFNANTTADPNPTILGKQTITFASQEGTTIYVSDDEMAGVQNTYNDLTYTFKPSYLNMAFKAGDDIYTLIPEYDGDNDVAHKPDCSSFVKVPATGDDTKVEAFRPYFRGPSAVGARNLTRSITFRNDDSQMKGVVEKGDPSKEEAGGTLNIYAKKHKIIVESSLNYTTDVRIVNLAGMTINSFTIEPGQTIETRVNNSGVYIVEPSEARYIKKLSVK